MDGSEGKMTEVAVKTLYRKGMRSFFKQFTLSNFYVLKKIESGPGGGLKNRLDLGIGDRPARQHEITFVPA